MSEAAAAAQQWLDTFWRGSMMFRREGVELTMLWWGDVVRLVGQHFNDSMQPPCNDNNSTLAFG